MTDTKINTDNFEDEVNPKRKDKIALALSKAQAGFKPLHKSRLAKFPTKSGSTISYAYADLADVFDSCREALTKNELAITQYVISDFLVTELWHSSGQFFKSGVPLHTPQNTGPQAFGSALTYARRYGLSALLGIVAEDDDDAHIAETTVKNAPLSQTKAQAPTSPPQRKPLATKPQPQGLSHGYFGDKTPNPNWKEEPATEAQIKRLYSMGKNMSPPYGHEELKTLAADVFGVEHLQELTKGQIQVLFNEIEGPNPPAAA